MSVEDDQRMSALLMEEAAKARKLEIIFGPWWRHYALPSEFRWTLYCERPSCLYCGASLGPLMPETPLMPGAQGDEASQVHMEHMDPLFHGGEESIRNTVYVCAACNISKGRKLFLNWLKELAEIHRAQARATYTVKHGEPPEAFVRRRRTPRFARHQIELGLSESVLRTLYPAPIVTGPPRY